ncbi:DAN domain family member 5 [Megalops cyprinoides]|uniref:DAN domain family member 5 n=1 Tax=Megalops cyprinoides TaxID=118141 RepID=UPI001863A6B8|nr:DAN domain family member 5 [Megalops cyprinoides]
MCGFATGIPPHTFTSIMDGLKDFESSGNGADEPLRGTVKVVKVNPNFLRQSALFRRGTALRNRPSRRGALPAFLALGRAGPAPSSKGPLPSTPFQLFGSNVGVEVKRRQGQEMWQRAMDKGNQDKEVMALPINPKDTSKQNCAAVPFVQRVTAAGCESVRVHNKLCFGQCSSLYIPPGGESPGSMAVAGLHSSPCSRCAPSKVRSTVVTLRCLGTMKPREERVLIVEDCKCETGREEVNAERSRPHLRH